jgi:hypothetical protein
MWRDPQESRKAEDNAEDKAAQMWRDLQESRKNFAGAETDFYTARVCLRRF